jgi:hypothetical protein
MKVFRVEFAVKSNSKIGLDKVIANLCAAEQRDLIDVYDFYEVKRER